MPQDPHTTFGRMVVSTCIATAAAASLSCTTLRSPIPTSAAVVSSGLGETLHRYLTSAADTGFNGAVLIAQNGYVVLHQGYGFADRERTVRVGTSTPFWVVSVSKQFAAGAILKLVDEGRISIDDPIAGFFPDVPADKRAITIHQLLTHTAGLAGRDAAASVPERDTAVQAILAGELARVPGSEYGYTNDAYTLIAAIVEIVADEPYETYVRRVLLQPGGPKNTGFWGPLAEPHVAAILPASWGSPALLLPNWGYRGARGMYSTAGDLYAWYKVLSEHSLISSTSVDRMFKPHAASRSTGVAYGWFVSQTPRGTTSLWTRGNQGSGHGAVLAVFPEDRVVIVIVSNTDRYVPGAPMGHKLAAELSALVLGP